MGGEIPPALKELLDARKRGMGRGRERWGGDDRERWTREGSVGVGTPSGREMGTKGGSRFRLQIFLFCLTIVSTLFAGAQFYVPAEEIFQDPTLLFKGIPFSFSILSILLAHEMGHYITSRIYGVDVTLPYFIPAPTIFGTMGAVIRMRSPIREKSVLFDIGAAGPLAGMVVAVPLIILGLGESRIGTIPVGDGPVIYFGESILFQLITNLVVGEIPEGTDLILGPVAFAGWVGLLVTALNLMPIGQLDGGHIAYALFGRRQRVIARLFFILLIFMGIFYFQGWLVWALLVLIIGIDHPPVRDDALPLNGKRKSVAWLSFLIFILTFVPTPIRIEM